MPTYRVEEASSARAGCKGPKPCGKEHKIPKGGLRFGSLVTIGGHDSWAWRHWGCCTPKVITNLKEAIENDTENLDGFEDLSPENQQKIRTALDEEHVDDADIPDSARKPPGEEGEEDGQDADSPKKKRSPAKKGGKKAAAKDGDDAEEKPKRKRAPPKKKAKAEEFDDEGEEEEEFQEEPEEKPKSKRGRQGAAKKKEESDEDEEEVMPKPKQRKRVKDDSE